eukprot:6123929-Alexandrium_andersonii.AAC.1
MGERPEAVGERPACVDPGAVGSLGLCESGGASCTRSDVQQKVSGSPILPGVASCSFRQLQA